MPSMTIHLSQRQVLILLYLRRTSSVRKGTSKGELALLSDKGLISKLGRSWSLTATGSTALEAGMKHYCRETVSSMLSNIFG